MQGTSCKIRNYAWNVNNWPVCVANCFLTVQIVHFQLFPRNQLLDHQLPSKCLYCKLKCISKYTRNQLLEQLPPGSPLGKLCWVTVGQILLQRYKYSITNTDKYSVLKSTKTNTAQWMHIRWMTCELCGSKRLISTSIHLGMVLYYINTDIKRNVPRFSDPVQSHYIQWSYSYSESLH